VNYPSFIWTTIVESCGSLTSPTLDFSLGGNLSNVFCFCLFLLNFSEMLYYIVIKEVDPPVHNCDIGVPLLYKALCFRPIPQHFLNLHVIPCSTWVIVRVSKLDFPQIFCSNFKLFKHQTVRSSRVHCIYNFEEKLTCIGHKAFYNFKINMNWKCTEQICLQKLSANFHWMIFK
jgi:hypothetical protein